MRGLAARRTATEAALRAAADGLSARGVKRRIAARWVEPASAQLGLPGVSCLSCSPHWRSQAHTDARACSCTSSQCRLDANPVQGGVSGELSRLMLALKVRGEARCHRDLGSTRWTGNRRRDRCPSGVKRSPRSQRGIRSWSLPPYRRSLPGGQSSGGVEEARRGIATSDVQVLHGEDRVNEIARMLGDAEGDAARRHAQALLRTPAVARRH